MHTDVDTPGDFCNRALRVVVAGGGKMAQQHMRAIEELGGRASLVGVADPSTDARAALSRDRPELAFAPDLPSLIAGTRADVVHVCTPMETHAEVARQALEMGCHAYVEKPFTPSVAELDPLLSLAGQKGLHVCAGHQVLFEAPYRRLVELLPGIGSPVHVESYFTFRPVRTQSGRGRPLTQDEQLADVLPHPVYLLLDLLERIEPSGTTRIAAAELSHSGTLHALVRRGDGVGSLVASLEGRPVEHWLRVVGTNGTIHADFVRGSVQDLLGPGASGIDKALNPFRLGRQMLTRNARSLVRRILNRGGSYPGLREIFEAFYRSIQEGAPPPTSRDQIRGTVGLCEKVSSRMERRKREALADIEGVKTIPPKVLVTGGTGLLGREVVRELLGRGVGVRVVSRRAPAAGDRIPGAEYLAGDLAQALPSRAMNGIRVVVHCAAETSGGWDAHERNSVQATERLIRSAAQASVATFVHVSSVAVLGRNGRGAFRDDSPLHPNPRSLGPYAWGKAESERLVSNLAEELGIRTRIVRPVPLVDWDAFDAPGRLGRRVGNLFVAVGSPWEPLVVADARSSAKAVVAAALFPERVPSAMNLVPTRPPTRRELVSRLRKESAEVRVIWLPRPLLVPMSWAAMAFQKLLRPRRPAVRVVEAFARRAYAPGPAASLMDEEEDKDRVPERDGAVRAS